MICGHQKIITALKKNFNEKRLSHAYLFIGPGQVGKKTVALNLIKTVQCQEKNKPCGKCSACIQIEKNCHPDTTIIQEEGKIKISVMREVQQKMSLKTYNSPYKVLLIDNAENLTEEAANSILKFLEEPKGDTLIILVASNIKAVLPTIISRCAIVKFFPVAKNEILKYCSSDPALFLYYKRAGESRTNLEELIHYSCGRPGQVIEWLKNPTIFFENKAVIEDLKKVIASNKINEKFKFVSKFYLEREESLSLLSKMLLFYHDILLAKNGANNFVANLSEKEFIKQYSLELGAGEILENLSQIAGAQKLIAQNANLKLVMENVVLGL